MKSKELSKIFKALSNPYRLELFLSILKDEQASVEKEGCFLGELISHFKIGAPTISHHLKELVNANLVKTEKEGKFVICKVNHDQLKQIGQLLSFRKS